MEEEPVLDKTEIIEYSNHNVKSSNKSNDNPIESKTASTEEDSIINLALILSNEKKLKTLISTIRDNLSKTIKDKASVLDININDSGNVISKTIQLPNNDNFFTPVFDKKNETSKMIPIILEV